MAHSTEKLMITTYTRTDGTACVHVCNFAHIRRTAVSTGNWILHLDYRDGTELLQICPARSKWWCLEKGLSILLLENVLSFVFSLNILSYFLVFIC